jgi:hypothetical protein
MILDETLQNPPFSFSIYREQSYVNRSRNYGTTGTGDRQLIGRVEGVVGAVALACAIARIGLTVRNGGCCILALIHT